MNASEVGKNELVLKGPLDFCRNCGSLIRINKIEVRTREECTGREPGHNGDNVYSLVAYKGYTCPECNQFRTLSSSGGRVANQNWD